MLYSFHYGSKRDVRILIVTTKMKGIYANIIWFAIVIFGLSGAAFWRHNSTEWASMADSRLVYNLVYGLVAMYLIVATVGLIIKRKWGYVFAVSANAMLALISIGLLLASLVMARPTLSVQEIVQINSSNLLAGLVSLCFCVWLLKSKVRNIYS